MVIIMTISKVIIYCADLLGHDAVTCCAQAENHCTVVSKLIADWLAEMSDVTV